jgi:hypothetical protein
VRGRAGHERLPAAGCAWPRRVCAPRRSRVCASAQGTRASRASLQAGVRGRAGHACKARGAPTAVACRTSRAATGCGEARRQWWRAGLVPAAVCSGGWRCAAGTRASCHHGRCLALGCRTRSDAALRTRPVPSYCRMLVRKLLLPTTLRNAGVGGEAHECGCACLRVCRCTGARIQVHSAAYRSAAYRRLGMCATVVRSRVRGCPRGCSCT